MRVIQDAVSVVVKKSPVSNAEGLGREEKIGANEGKFVVSKQEQKSKEEVVVSKPEAKEIDDKEIIKAIEEANKKFKDDGRIFEFSVHEKTKQIMVKVLDTQTQKVIKEFPPEKILDMVANMCELAGLFVDEKR